MMSSILLTLFLFHISQSPLRNEGRDLMKTFLLELNVLRFITLCILSGYKYLYLFPSAAVESIINFSATIRLNF